MEATAIGEIVQNMTSTILGGTNRAHGENEETVDNAKMAELVAKYPTLDSLTDDFLKSETFEHLSWTEKVMLFRIAGKKTAAEMREELIRRYNLNPDVSDDLILQIRGFESEQLKCSGCNGEKCQKKESQYFEPVMQINEGYPEFLEVICRKHKQWNKQKKLTVQLQNAKIPKRYEGLTFEDYKTTAGNEDAVKCAKWILEDGKAGLLLVGKCGVGKTMLASIVANEAVKRGISVIFATVPSILANIKATFGGDEKTSEVMRTLIDVPLLILDDFGTEKPSDWVAETLFTIINERYNEMRQTIVTTNFGIGELREHLSKDKSGKIQTSLAITSERLISRLVEMCHKVEIIGKDWRQR